MPTYRPGYVATGYLRAHTHGYTPLPQEGARIPPQWYTPGELCRELCTTEIPRPVTIRLNAEPTTGGLRENALWAQNAIWSQWVEQTRTPQTYRPPPPVVPSEQLRREQLIYGNRRRAEELRRKQAIRNAERLLLEHLTRNQKREWEDGKTFVVHTANGARAYRIRRGLAGNITLVKCDEPPPVKAGQIRVGSRFCAHVYHPDGWIPEEDNVLAQKLFLETDETQFLTMANVS